MDATSIPGRIIAGSFALAFSVFTGVGFVQWKSSVTNDGFKPALQKWLMIEILFTLTAFFALTALYYYIGPKSWYSEKLRKYAFKAALVAILVNLAIITGAIAFII